MTQYIYDTQAPAASAANGEAAAWRNAGLSVSISGPAYYEIWQSIGHGEQGLAQYGYQYTVYGDNHPVLAGKNGGPAIKASSPINIYNYGTIGGGGGGGGAGRNGGGGGGGAGSTPGRGGYRVPGGGYNGNSIDGYVGSLLNGGRGGHGSGVYGGADGGYGGGPGQGGTQSDGANSGGSDGGGGGGGLGADGGLGDTTGGYGQTGYIANGLAGPCVNGNANITWVVVGARYGALN